MRLIALLLLAALAAPARAEWQYQLWEYRYPRQTVYVWQPVWVPDVPPVIAPTSAPAYPVAPVNVSPPAMQIPANCAGPV